MTEKANFVHSLREMTQALWALRDKTVPGERGQQVKGPEAGLHLVRKLVWLEVCEPRGGVWR